MNTILVNKIDELKSYIQQWKKEGKTIGLVPTMGALHKGHESLIKKAVETCDKVVVSVFVNPIQFGPNEDFDKYPRTLDADKHLCESNNVNIVFAPNASEMYGKDFANPDLQTNKHLTYVYPPYSLVDKLCGKTRTGHFDGVATVVLKLLNLVQPDSAFFGQKDAQQLIIIKKMVKDLNVPVNIIGCPIVREEDGLALSSRNKYLSAEARKKALSISKALFYVKDLISKGEKDVKILFDSAINLLDKDIELEYLEFVDTENLISLESINPKTLIAIAARVDNVRLIDNIILE